MAHNLLLDLIANTNGLHNLNRLSWAIGCRFNSDEHEHGVSLPYAIAEVNINIQLGTTNQFLYHPHMFTGLWAICMERTVEVRKKTKPTTVSTTYLRVAMNTKAQYWKVGAERQLIEVPYFGISAITVRLRIWCRRRDSNPHAVKHYPLKIACLPVSPLRLFYLIFRCYGYIDGNIGFWCSRYIWLNGYRLSGGVFRLFYARLFHNRS